MPQPTALKPPSTARTAGRSGGCGGACDASPLSCFLFRPRKSREKRRKRSHTNVSNASVIRTSRVSQTPLQTPIPYFHQWVPHGKKLLSQSPAKRPTFAFTHESGYTLGFAQRIAHSGSHGETGGVSDGALSLPSAQTACSRISLGRVSERQSLPLLGLGRGCSQRTQRAFGTAMRLCASLSRRCRGPAGLRDLFRFCRSCGLYTLRSELSVRARQGWYHYPRCAPHAAETPDGRLSKRLICRFLRSGD